MHLAVSLEKSLLWTWISNKTCHHNNANISLNTNYAPDLVEWAEYGREDQGGRFNVYKEILVKFRGNENLIKYTANILKLLKTDASVEYICSGDTGEIIYSKR